MGTGRKNKFFSNVPAIHYRALLITKRTMFITISILIVKICVENFVANMCFCLTLRIVCEYVNQPG